MSFPEKKYDHPPPSNAVFPRGGEYSLGKVLSKTRVWEMACFVELIFGINRMMEKLPLVLNRTKFRQSEKNLISHVSLAIPAAKKTLNYKVLNAASARKYANFGLKP